MYDAAAVQFSNVSRIQIVDIQIPTVLARLISQNPDAKLFRFNVSGFQMFGIQMVTV